jgi:hypothetical protein
MSIYDSENSVQQSFDENAIPEEQLQTQWAEFIELKKVIADLYVNNKKSISVLDIGIGDGRIVKHLSGIKEIWECIGLYDGIDNAVPCLAISTKLINDLKIQDKVKLSYLEAHHLDTVAEKYDLIITTWFTAGNFYPQDFPFETYRETGKRIDLSENKRFEKIFFDAYNLLNPGGEILIGSCYIDNDNTRKKQEAFYKKMGMTVITDSLDTFTATKEKFWSQRFTKEKLQHYLSFATPEKIIYTPLDTYDFAMQVRIKK